MDSHPWFQQRSDALKKAGVNKKYSDRLMSELWFHYIEMKEQKEMSNGMHSNTSDDLERLGSPEILAMQAASVRNSTWTGRHPWLAFVFGAPATALGSILLTVFLSALIFIPIAQGKTLESSPWMGTVLTVLGPMQVILPATVVCLLLCRAVSRSHHSTWWGLAGCGLIALLCGAANIHWTPAVSIPGTGQLSMGLGFPFTTTWFQTLAPIVIGSVYAFRNLPSRRPPQDTEPSIHLKSAA